LAPNFPRCDSVCCRPLRCPEGLRAPQTKPGQRLAGLGGQSVVVVVGNYFFAAV
jgi:hypothetical protein